jgi:signal transduction histidine kinase
VTLQRVADLAVRGFGDWCTVAIGDSTGRHRVVATAHRDPARKRWAEEYARLNPRPPDAPSGVARVLRSGRSELYPHIGEDLLVASATSDEDLRVLRELRMRSAMVVPMITRGRTVGAITFISAESKHSFSGDDLAVAEQLAERAAVAVDNSQLFAQAREAESVAVEANRAKTDFLASMSHELRTPLNALAGYAELLEMGIHGELPPAQKDMVARIRRSQRHLQGLIEDVLGFARIEAGKLEIELDDVAVGASVVRVSEFVLPQFAAKSLDFDVAPVDPRLRVRADRDRLQQIILNLLTNAAKFTPANGSVRVAIETAGSTVRINVIDTGVGIPADKHEAIFEPFVQLSGPNKSGPGGTGLGLAISRNLARAMNGDVTVRSESGSGSTFTIELPRAPEASLPAAATGARHEAHDGGRVPTPATTSRRA